MIDGAVVVSASPSLGATPGRQGLAAQRFVKPGEFSSSLPPRAPSPERSLGPPHPSGVPAEETHLEGDRGRGAVTLGGRGRSLCLPSPSQAWPKGRGCVQINGTLMGRQAWVRLPAGCQRE